MKMKKKECKKHKWRVGSGVAELIDKTIITTCLNIWCENCDKKIKARYFPSFYTKKDIIKENENE